MFRFLPVQIILACLTVCVSAAQVKVTSLPAPEIVKRHRFIAQNLAKSASPELAIELKAALAANESQP